MKRKSIDLARNQAFGLVDRRQKNVVEQNGRDRAMDHSI